MGKLTEFPLESENEIRMPNNTCDVWYYHGQFKNIRGGKWWKIAVLAKPIKSIGKLKK